MENNNVIDNGEMYENRVFYWQARPIILVRCPNHRDACPVACTASNNGIEYRYRVDDAGLKHVYLDYFPHKAPNLDIQKAASDMVRACRQCWATHSQKAR